MSLADIAIQEDEDFMNIDKKLRELLGTNSTAAVAYYVLLTPKHKSWVQEQDYWQVLDEKIEFMLYGQI